MRQLLTAILFTPLLIPADYKVGVARQIITPDKPTWMIGYAGRNRPSEGVIQELWAKALDIEDSKGARTLIITTDLASISQPLAASVAERIGKESGIPRERLLINVSHNH